MIEPGSKLSELGKRLRTYRLKAGLKQEEVGRKMGLTGKCPRAMINRLEQGKLENPSLMTIDRYLRVCHARWSQIADIRDWGMRSGG